MSSNAKVSGGGGGPVGRAVIPVVVNLGGSSFAFCVCDPVLGEEGSFRAA